MLAMPPGEKGASWRARGWVGENDRSDRALHPPQVAGQFRHPRLRKVMTASWWDHLQARSEETNQPSSRKERTSELGRSILEMRAD